MVLRTMRRVAVTLAVLCLLVLTVWPFHDRLLKLGLPLSLYIVWAELLRRCWSRRGARAVLVVLPFLPAGKADGSGGSAK